MSAHLALGAAALLAGAAAAVSRPGLGSRNGPPGVAELREALRQSGSPNRGRGSFNGPGVEKVYDLFLRVEPADVPDELLVGVLLAGGRGDPVEKARRLLESVGGSVGQIVEGSAGHESDLTDAQRARIRAGAELARRAQIRQFLSGKSDIFVRTPEDAVDILKQASTGPRETISAIYLSRQVKLLAIRKISEGTSSMTLIDPVEILRVAILLRCDRYMIAHQHPSGDHTPSSADLNATSRLKNAGNAIGINLIDHLIIGGDGRYSSLRQAGFI